jgi:hypothetical protein
MHCANSYSLQTMEKLQHSSAAQDLGSQRHNSLLLLSSAGRSRLLPNLLESHSYHWDSDEVAAVAFHGDLSETVGAGHGPRRQGHS